MPLAAVIVVPDALRSGPLRSTLPPATTESRSPPAVSEPPPMARSAVDAVLVRDPQQTLIPLPSQVSGLSVASRRGPAKLNVLPPPTLTKNPPDGGKPNVVGEAFNDTNGTDELLDTVAVSETTMPLVAVIGALTALRSGPLSSRWLRETSRMLSPTCNGLPASVISGAVVELVSDTGEQHTEIRPAASVMELSLASSSGPARLTTPRSTDRNEP